MERPSTPQDSLIINTDGLAAGDTALDLVMGRKPTVGIGAFDNKMAAG